MSGLMTLVAVMVAAGYVLRKTGLASGEAAGDVNRIVFYVTLPPLVFRALQHATLSWSLLLLPMVAWGMTLAGIALALLLARSLRLDRPRAGALVVALVFGNTTYLGYPIVQGLFGPGHLTLAIFYDLLGATMATHILGAAIASAYGGPEGTPRSSTFRRVLTLPALWAMVLGLALNGTPLPPLLDRLLEQVGAITSPLIMLSIGLSLRLSDWREDLHLVGLATAGRLVVLPALVWGAVSVLGFPLAYRQAAVIEAGTPTMFYSLTLAMLFGLRVPIVVNAIMVSTLLGFVTLPVWRSLLAP